MKTATSVFLWTKILEHSLSIFEVRPFFANFWLFSDPTLSNLRLNVNREQRYQHFCLYKQLRTYSDKIQQFYTGEASVLVRTFFFSNHLNSSKLTQLMDF